MLSAHKIYQAPPPTKNQAGEVILGRTLLSLLDEACNRSPNPHAFNQWTEAGWLSLSQQAFKSATQEVALGLGDLGLVRGDRIALLMHSDVNFCIADMGTLLANLVNVPIDLSQTIENIVFILQHSQAKALIVSHLDLLYQIAPYLWEAPDLQTVIVADISQEDAGKGRRSDAVRENVPVSLLPNHIQVLSLSEVRHRGRIQMNEDNLSQLRTAPSAAAKLSQLNPHDLATIIYIPVTTEQPLGVMLTHENLSANALAMFTGITNLKFGAQEVVLSFLPLTHVFARVLLYGHINYGHSIYFCSPNRVIKHLAQVQPTIFATVPLLLEKLYSKILEGGRRGHGDTGTRGRGEKMIKGEEDQGRTGGVFWRITASPRLHLFASYSHSIYNWSLKQALRYELGQAPRGKYALMLKLADRLVFLKWRLVFGGRLKYLICGGAALKAEIANLFGAANITVLHGYGLTETSSAVTCNRDKFNRAGTVGVPILGVEVAIADDGEIFTKSPYNTQGYYKNPDATKQLIDADGWLHTGDLGEFTTDGFLKITGLKKSRFKLSTGKYVIPQPLESKLEQSPLVTKAVAVGSERKFCTMLIFPNMDNLRQQTLALGLDNPQEGLRPHPCIIALYQALVDEANCHLPYWTTIKRFQLIDASLTVENGMLTATGEVNRAKVVQVFAQEIDAMYGELGIGKVGSPRSGDEGHGEWGIEDISSCPYIPVYSCPVSAQSLNSS